MTETGFPNDVASNLVQDSWSSVEELLPDQATDPVDAVRSGLPYATLERVQRAMGLPNRLLAPVLSISERTLHRREQEGRLTPDESVRLLLLAEVGQLAFLAFDGVKEARSWLTNPHALLGGESPLEHMDTLAGLDEIRTMLYHIEHSMPA